ncbi:hypothetical protein L6164_001986 [Bauhinia variegata]|uniref:Uncharacterized protein n=1 Tax=Bauhinia variegata TaxID=167791 RepID=A0ACB9PWA7_BAUVA|nr:hypothetical protein L6164_001986 [Bauhinia variegata]
MEIVSKIVEKLLDCTLTPVERQVGYVISYKDNVNKLKEQAKRLLDERKALQHRVDAARRNVEEIEGPVEEWLSKVKEYASKAKILLDHYDKRRKRDAEEIEGEDLKWPDDIASKAKELLDKDDKRSKIAWCSSKSFSSMCWRHQISRKAKKLAEEIANIEGEKEFPQVSHPGELNITETLASSAKNDEAFESRVAALNQIMEALADPNLRLIGVHGLGGVGKTTLVRDVAIRVKEKSPDTNIVFVDVKQNPKIEKVQQDIADMLRLDLKEQNLLTRANLLCRRLQNDKEKNILVILDDLWEKLDMNKIGITFEKENKNYKILMTSRKKDVLSKMDTQKNFWLKELTEEESWELFKVKVALNESSKSKKFLTIAREVVQKCGGLPIAILAIAKGKEEMAEWRDVLQQLQNHNYDEINGSIVVSYENLKDDRIKSIFVLAGLINSSATIDLFKYCCGLDLLCSMDNFNARIRELKDSCLLQDNDSSMSHFSMHDVVRDTAISIASKDEQFFVKKIEKADEDEWITDDKLKSCRKMLLDFTDIGELPEGLQCSNLTFFYLRINDSSLKLPHNFFEGMPKLKVIVLINMTFEFLPSSISLLRNLHTLCLDECVLENIEGIGKLKGLKILSLSGSEFTNLPQEIGKLTKLHMLDLRRCIQLESIPPGVLLNLQKLEVLLMGSSFSKWAVGDQQSTASLAEIKDLRKLNTLAIDVPDQNMLPKEQLLESLHLERYEVCIGDSWFGESKTSRLLKVDIHTGIVDTKHYFKSLLEHVEDLHVRRLAGLKNIFPVMNEGLIELKHLAVDGNFELEFIADLVEHKDMIFPELELLDARNSKLVKLCNSSITEKTFSKLKVVNVSSCHKMKSLFSLSLQTCLPHLNEIKVDFCEVLEGIVSDAGQVVGPLQFLELRTLTLCYLPSLIGFYSEDETSSNVQRKKTQVGVLFSHKVFIPNLETLNIRSIGKLNKLWDQHFDGLSFRNLKILNITSCDGISKLLLFNVLENLEELEVSYCRSLEVIFDLEGTRKEETHEVVKSSHLRKLTLASLPKLKHVWNKDPKNILGFQFLSTIEAWGCDSLNYFFPASVAKALAKLHFLSITRCCELESIVGREEGADVPINFLFARVTELHLQRLPKLMSFYPGTYSTEWPLLQNLYCKFVGRSWNIFGSGLLGFEEFHCQNGSEVSTQLSHAIQKSIPMLKELKLDYNKNMMAWIQRYSPDICWNEIKILKLQFFHDVSLWTFIQSMYALETLHVKYGSLEEIFPPEREVIDITQRGRGIHIKTLTIDGLSKLKHICREGNEQNPMLERLEELYISECSGLSNLVPSSIKFNHLASIVFGCNGILHIISSFTAKSLSRLTTMEIKECKMMKEIVAGKVTDDEIMFSELKTLTLENLPQLESYCSLNCVFSFPALENVVIAECPKLKLFSKQAPNTTKLRSVKESDRSGANSYWEDDLNSTIQKLYTDKVCRNSTSLELQFPADHLNSLEVFGLQFLNDVNTGFSYSVLQKMSNLKTLIVKDGLSEEIFPFKKQVVKENYSGVVQLKGLWVENLQKLRHICEEEYELDPSLKKLKGLYIEECSRLLNLGPSSLTFNFLKILGIKKCEQLSNLMTPSTAKSLGKLEYLKIEDCSMIKEIILGKVVDAQNEITFSRLEVLMLKNLPCLESFCSMKYVFNFPCLEDLVIWQCPNLKKFFNGVSSTPNLERIVGERGSDWLEFDLNSTGRKMYKYEVHNNSISLEFLDYVTSEVDLPNVDDLWDVDSESDDEHLNELDQFEVEEEDKVEEHKEREKEKAENINSCITEQNTISYPESRDIDLQASANEDITLITPLLAISQEYQTSGKGGSQKKKEDMNVIEQSTTSYSENMEAHTKQKQGFEISIRNFDSEKRLQEQHIHFRESMGETTNIDDDQALPLEILTEATSSLDSIIEEPMSELVLMDRQEGLEQNQVTIEFLGRTDVIPEAVHNAIELINRSVSTVSTSKELQGLGRCSPISQPFSSIANVAGSLEVKPIEVVQSTQDCQESDSNGSKSNSFLQIQTMTRHGGELQSKEVHQEPKKPHISPTNLGEEIPKKEPNSELILTDQQLTLEGNKASRELQPLATNSLLSPISGYPPSTSYQSLDSVAKSSGFLTLSSINDTTAISGPPLTSNATIPSPLEDLLSRLHLFSSYEEMSYLRDGFSRYPWALHLLESWSDERWKWSYFTIFARVLCILQTTRAADLSETLNAELTSSLNTLESVGFNANWIAAIRGRIRYCQDGLTNVNEAKALRASKDVIASRLTEFELAMRTELARIDALLAKYAQREELVRNVIGLP